MGALNFRCMPACPMCRMVRGSARNGHCKVGGLMHSCRPPNTNSGRDNGAEGNEGDEGNEGAWRPLGPVKAMSLRQQLLLRRQVACHVPCHVEHQAARVKVQRTQGAGGSDGANVVGIQYCGDAGSVSGSCIGGLACSAQRKRWDVRVMVVSLYRPPTVAATSSRLVPQTGLCSRAGAIAFKW